MNFLIRDFKDDDPVAEITSLLHRAYRPLAELGLKYVASYQNDDRTLSRIRSGRCFLAIDQDKIVGTITYYAPDPERQDWPVFYHKAGHFGQFAVEPVLQKQGLGKLLMDHVESSALRSNIFTIGFDTSEHALDLISYYERRGYSHAGHHQWEMTNYRSVIMKKELKG